MNIIGDRLFTKRWVNVALTGQVSKRFTESEEEQIKVLLQTHAFASGRKGTIATEEARKIIGLSETPSENTQLSNLFRKWSQKNIIKQVKRGHWRFLTEAELNTLVIMEFVSNYQKQFGKESS